MAVAIIGKPSWPYRPARGHDPRGRVVSDRSQPDQGPAQEIIGKMAWLLRDTRGSMVLGGSVLSAITIVRRRIQLADTWTYITAAYFGVWIVVILLGL